MLRGGISTIRYMTHPKLFLPTMTTVTARTVNSRVPADAYRYMSTQASGATNSAPKKLKKVCESSCKPLKLPFKFPLQSTDVPAAIRYYDSTKHTTCPHIQRIRAQISTGVDALTPYNQGKY